MRPLATPLPTILVHTSRGFRVHPLICRGSGFPLFLSRCSCQLTRRPFCQTPTGRSGVLLSHPSPDRSLRRGLLGLAPHRLDSCCAWCCRCHPLESHKPEEAVLLASQLDQGRTWETRASSSASLDVCFSSLHLQRPPLCGWSEIASQVALTYTASVLVGLAAQQAGRPDLIRSPKRVLAHLWERESEL